MYTQIKISQFIEAVVGVLSSFVRLEAALHQ
jgi:hypothetical protein